MKTPGPSSNNINSNSSQKSNFEKFKFGSVSVQKLEDNLNNYRTNPNQHNRIRSEQMPFKISQLFGSNRNPIHKKGNFSTGNKLHINNFPTNPNILSTNPETNSNNYNINPTFNNNNNNNFIFNSPIFKFGNIENEEDKYKDNLPFSSSDNKQNSKKKNQMFKIVNMYMKDDKKKESTLMLDQIYKKRKKKLFSIINQSNQKYKSNETKQKTKPKIDTNLKSIYQIKKNFNWSNRKEFQISRKQLLLKKIFSKIGKKKLNLSLYDHLNLDTNIHIPKKGKKNPSSNLYISAEKKREIYEHKKRSSKNIMNFVNSIRGKKDLNLNINQFDIKCYRPKANEITEQDLSSSSQMRNSSLNITSGGNIKTISKSKLNVDVDFIKIGTDKEKSSKKLEDIYDKKIRRQILNKVKSYKEDVIVKRPQLKISSSEIDSNSKNSYDLGHERINFQQININELDVNDSSEDMTDKSDKTKLETQNEIEMDEDIDIEMEEEINETDEDSNFTIVEQKGREWRNKWFRKGQTEKVEDMHLSSSESEVNHLELSLPHRPLIIDNYEESFSEEKNDSFDKLSEANETEKSKKFDISELKETVKDYVVTNKIKKDFKNLSTKVLQVIKNLQKEEKEKKEKDTENLDSPLKFKMNFFIKSDFMNKLLQKNNDGNTDNTNISETKLIIVSLLDDILSKIIDTKSQENLSFSSKSKTKTEISKKESDSITNNSVINIDDEIKTQSEIEKEKTLTENINENYNKILTEKNDTENINISDNDQKSISISSKSESVKKSDSDGWAMKYDDEAIEELKKPFKENLKKIKKTTSFKTQRKIEIDYLCPQDIKKGLFKEKNLKRSKSQNPTNFKNLDKILIKKNLKFRNLDFEESEESLSPERLQYKIQNIEKEFFVLKNKKKIEKIRKRSTLNVNTIMENPYINAEVKIKLMDLQSSKNQLKEEIDEKILLEIKKTIDADLIFCKNNKISKTILNFHREKKYEIDYEKFENENNEIENPTFLAAKGKVLQENTNYLVSTYFDIYDEILNNIFNSGESIFEFNDTIKGDSILKNFTINANLENKEVNLDTIKFKKDKIQKQSTMNLSYTNKNKIKDEYKPRGSIIIEKKSHLEYELNNINNNNNNNQNANNNVNYMDEYSETKSNYDRLGLANQLYINNILLRDFSYKEKIQLGNKTNSDNSDSATEHEHSSIKNMSKTVKNLSGNITLKNDQNLQNETSKNEDNKLSTSNELLKRKKKKGKKNEKKKKIQFESLVNQNIGGDPVVVLNNIFNDKSEVSLLRNKEHLNNLVNTQNFPVIKSSNNKITINFRQKEKNQGENQKEKKIMSSTPLTKENTLFKTLEIKSSMLKSFKGNPSDILRFYLKDGNFVKFKENFERNKNLIDCLDENWDTLLNIAVKCNHYEIASYLMEHGADVNLQNVNFLFNLDK